MRTKRFISAREAIETATIGGANALRLNDQIGTLEAGKQADLAVVSLGNIAQQPVNDIYADPGFRVKRERYSDDNGRRHGNLPSRRTNEC